MSIFCRKHIFIQQCHDLDLHENSPDAAIENRKSFYLMQKKEITKTNFKRACKGKLIGTQNLFDSCEFRPMSDFLFIPFAIHLTIISMIAMFDWFPFELIHTHHNDNYPCDIGENMKLVGR